MKITDIKSWNHKLSKSAIIFVKTIENWLTLQMNSSQGPERREPFKLDNSNEENFKFLVYIEEMESLEELNNIPYDLLLPKYFDKSEMKFFEFFITHDRKFVNLSANLLFSEKNCFVFTPKLLNTFDIKSQKWNEILQNFDHFNNYHGCMLSFEVHQTYLWYYTQISGKKFKYNGLLYEILKISSEKLNFTTHYKCYDIFQEKYVHYQQKPKNHFIQEVKIHFGFIHNVTSSMWKAYESLNFYYLVTKNDLYTNYEKLFFPFDDTTWIYLSITFGLTFVIIFILKRCPRWIKIIVFGAGVKSPGYNVISILFGFSQSQVPRENFSRIILFFFIWFCLMFRNCYQSMIFDFMTTDMRKPMPQSVDDLYRMNYKIICLDHEGYIEMNKEIINGRESPQIFNVEWNNFQRIYEDAVNEVSNEKLAFFVSEGIHVKLNFTVKNSLPVLTNEKTSKHKFILFKKNFVLEKNLNFLIDRFLEVGITNHFIDYGTWYLHRPFEIKVEDSKRILSIKDLEYGFVIWIFACFVSIMVFLWEIKGKVYQNNQKVD
ncbi:hypothetical protein PVAND_006372 [Polypedilum vanderplanki]|uniref:Ionotropic receptor n=1 Tax=Polypedilum vanderplanki TaxID=319348 RepID=A0A9J6C402_POLVA|nr:hypothetical protein PVAND_006372 [Polypedilum vanderplanki]